MNPLTPNDQKQNPDIPEQNVLDLRKIMATRQAVAQAKTSKPWNLPRRRRTAPVLNLPTQSVVEWPKVKKEMLKFAVAAVAGAIPLLALMAMWRLGQEVKAVTVTTRTAYGHIQAGMSELGAFSIPTARQEFAEASTDLRAAEDKLDRVGWLPAETLAKLPVIGKKYTTAKQVIGLGQKVATAGGIFSSILPADQQPIPPITITSDGLIQGSVGVLKPLLTEPDKFHKAVDLLVAAAVQINQIDASVLPSAERQALETWQRLGPALLGSSDRMGDVVHLILALLTPDEPKEYLVIFQNNDELRATGGFAGTFLLVKFDRGIFTILDAPGTGPFDLTARNKKNRLPPQPVLAVAPYWTFHDANWFFDVPTSAGFMLDFYQQARGFRPDGMIFLTPGVVEDLLKITGPIRPEKYQVDITADNFVRATEEQVEFGYDKALNNPKQFLIDLIPALVKKLAALDGVEGLRASGSFLKRTTEADVLFYSEDKETTATIERLGWGGAIKSTPAEQDYLAVVDSNLGGGKTDRTIDVEVDVNVSVESGRAVHTVTIKRQHNGKKGDALSYFTNRDFIRVYAPANAEFIDIKEASIPEPGMFQTPAPETVLDPKLDAAEGQVLIDAKQGIRLSHENGKNVYGAWSIVGPGQSQTLKFSYATPLPTGKKSTEWTLLWQKQPGATTRQWTVTFDAGKEQKITSFLPFSGKEKGNHTVVFKTDSSVSRTFGVVFE